MGALEQLTEYLLIKIHTNPVFVCTERLEQEIENVLRKLNEGNKNDSN